MKQLSPLVLRPRLPQATFARPPPPRLLQPPARRKQDRSRAPHCRRPCGLLAAALAAPHPQPFLVVVLRAGPRLASGLHPALVAANNSGKSLIILPLSQLGSKKKNNKKKKPSLPLANSLHLFFFFFVSPLFLFLLFLVYFLLLLDQREDAQVVCLWSELAVYLVVCIAADVYIEYCCTAPPLLLFFF